ncbi:MAG: type II toxin-antitoxin system RelE/ParE family toxin [Candidatus Coatesbacteria bacterium]
MTSGYRVLLQPSAQRDLKRIGEVPRERLGEVILDLAENPRPRRVKKLSGGLSGYRVTCGDWRVLYEIDDSARIVTVWRVAHRSESYR